MAKGLFGSIGEFFFGKKKKQAPQAQPVPKVSLRDFPSGQLTFETLRERLARLKTTAGGVPMEFTRLGDVLATQERKGFREFTKPTIAAEASRAGLRRSTIPVGQVTLARSLAERGIGRTRAELGVKGLEFGAAELERTLARLQRFAEIQAQLKTGTTTQRIQAGQFAQSIEEARRTGDIERQKQIIATVGGLGLGGLQAFTAQRQSQNLIDAILEAQRQGATVNLPITV